MCRIQVTIASALPMRQIANWRMHARLLLFKKYPVYETPCLRGDEGQTVVISQISRIFRELDESVRALEAYLQLKCDPLFAESA
jgi:hypothetical protein